MCESVGMQASKQGRVCRPAGKAGQTRPAVLAQQGKPVQQGRPVQQGMQQAGQGRADHASSTAFRGHVWQAKSHERTASSSAGSTVFDAFQVS